MLSTLMVQAAREAKQVVQARQLGLESATNLTNSTSVAKRAAAEAELAAKRVKRDSKAYRAALREAGVAAATGAKAATEAADALHRAIESSRASVAALEPTLAAAAVATVAHSSTGQ